MNTILVTGYSKAPQGTPMHEVFKYSGMVLEVERETHKIVDAEVSFITDLAQDYFRRLLVGTNLSDLDGIIEKIQENYYAPSQQSIIVALKVAHQRYWDEVDSNE